VLQEVPCHEGAKGMLNNTKLPVFSSKKRASSNATGMNSLIRLNYALSALLLFSTSAVSHAEDRSTSMLDPANFTPESVWVNPGVLSYHFNQSAGYRGDNWGFGAQINFPHDLALLGGTFINSDRQRSDDAGIMWQPYSLGPIKLGGVAGAFNGYPYFKNGAWFPAVLPMASTSYKWVGANVTIIPNYKNRLHGALVLQLLFKVW
jgi:hypothetical protein